MASHKTSHRINANGPSQRWGAADRWFASIWVYFTIFFTAKGAKGRGEKKLQVEFHWDIHFLQT
jgi:hypothetical protein